MIRIQKKHSPSTENTLAVKGRIISNPNRTGKKMDRKSTRKDKSSIET